MKSRKRSRILPSASVICLVLGVGPLHAESVIVDGSSSVHPILQSAAESFMGKNPDAQIEVAYSGTTGGFRKFLDGKAAIVGASRPINPEELEQARGKGLEFIELPIAFDALTILVHPENDWVDHIKVSELKKLWDPGAENTVMNWNDIRPEWPNKPIELYGADTDSGTFDFFTEVIVGSTRSSRMDYTGCEDDEEIVRGVENDPYSLGYAPLAYVDPEAHGIRQVAVEWDLDPRTGESKVWMPVEPSRRTVLTGQYLPLGRPLFLYINRSDLEKNPTVSAFVEYLIGEGRHAIRTVGYQPLSEVAYLQARDRLGKMTTGTAFAGKTAPGISVHEIFLVKPVP